MKKENYSTITDTSNEFIMHRIKLIACLLVVMHLQGIGQDRITGKTFATRSEVIAPHGMVASSQPLATQVGLDILKKGGNAIDAAIAVDAMLGLTEPTGSGMGGDLFAIIWDAKTKKLYGLNASGRSPRSLTLDYFLKNGLQKYSSYRTIAGFCSWLCRRLV